jgi:hypothetical protein
MKTATLCKFPGEMMVFAFDLSEQPEIVAGDTLSGTPTVAHTLVSGSGTLTLGSPSISGSKIQLQVSGGTNGATWKLVVTVATLGGSTICAKGLLKIDEV